MNAISNPENIVPDAHFYALILAMLLFSGHSYAGGPALECRGSKSDNPDVQYELTLNALNKNSVVAIDASTQERCSCNFRQSGFFDQSKGVSPRYSILMTYESCDNKCSPGMKQQISAIIEVTHKIFEAKSHATPFVGAQISNCDTFSVDLPAMRRMESQRIDAMDQSQRFKDIPKARNGISH